MIYENKRDAIAALERVFDLRTPINSRGVVYGLAWEDADIIRALDERLGLIDESFIVEFSEALANFTPFGFRLILPYYLRFSMLNPESSVAEFVIYRISNMGAESKHWSSFSAQEICLVHSLLEYIKRLTIEAGQLDDFVASRINVALANLAARMALPH